MLADFSAETMQTRSEGHNVFKVLKGKTFPTKYTLSSKIIIQNGEIELSSHSEAKKVHYH